MVEERIFFTSPEPNGKTEWTKVKTLPDGSKEWYKYKESTKEWELTGIEQSAGVTATHESKNLKITKLVVINGLITELEAEK
ncbi:MAG: hypothetical protein WC822_05295 [Candidatus Paceibacterota bacterium]|jgi:hypothetical protein